MAVIGSMLYDPSTIPIALETITEDYFFFLPYKILFRTMSSLYKAGKNCDVITVKDNLDFPDGARIDISLDTIKEIFESVPTAANIKEYAQIVYEKALLRNLLDEVKYVEKEINEGTEKTEEILESAEKRIFDVVQRRNTGDIEPVRHVVGNFLNKIERAALTKGAITGLPTGFIDLDNQLSGLQPSNLILVAARPSVGKTAFVCNIMEHIALKRKKPVVFFSLEMPAEELVSRLTAQHAMVDSQKIKVGNLNDTELGKIMETADVIANSDIFIDDSSNITIGEVRSKCRKLKLEHDIQLVIIDYLQLMNGSGKKDQSREQVISEMSRSLKILARELNIPVIALSQLNRAVETRTDKKPIIADLRESGAIEQDADVIMLLSRKYDENEKKEDRNTIVVNVAKHRNGPVGEVELLWMGEYTKFQSKARERV